MFGEGDFIIVVVFKVSDLLTIQSVCSIARFLFHTVILLGNCIYIIYDFSVSEETTSCAEAAVYFHWMNGRTWTIVSIGGLRKCLRCSSEAYSFNTFQESKGRTHPPEALTLHSSLFCYSTSRVDPARTHGRPMHFSLALLLFLCLNISCCRFFCCWCCVCTC